MLEGVDMVIYLFYLPPKDGTSRGEPVGMGGEQIFSLTLSESFAPISSSPFFSSLPCLFSFGPTDALERSS